MSTHPISVWSVVALACMLASAASTPAYAKDFERIRVEASFLKGLMTTAFERSPTFRSLVERIDESDVVVYMTCESFSSYMLRGRTLLVAAEAQVRYLRVQILCLQPEPDIITIVAHELQHVVEIASTASVVDGRSFAELFARIGFSTWAKHSEQFETFEAIDSGRRVRAEVLSHATAAVQTADGRGWYAERGAHRRVGSPGRIESPHAPSPAD